MYKYYSYPLYNEERVVGVAVPFLLGGLTGGLIAPYFYRPNYYPNNMYYQNNYVPYYNGYKIK